METTKCNDNLLKNIRSFLTGYRSKKNFQSCLPVILYGMVLTILISSCQEDELEIPALDDENTQGVEVIDSVSNAPEPFPGSIGLVVDTRRIVKKGYHPAMVELIFEGEFSSYSTELEVDELTNLAKFEITRDSLDEEKIESFEKGVSVQIKVLGQDGKELGAASDDKLVIDDSNRPFAVETDLPAKTYPLSLNPEVPYIVQLLNTEELGYSNNNTLVMHQLETYPYLTVNQYSSGAGYNQFFFEKVEEGNDTTYFIKAAASGTYLKMDDFYFDAIVKYTMLMESNATTAPDEDNYKFVLKRDTTGNIYIRPYAFESVLGLSNILTSKGHAYFAGGERQVKFRIVTGNIEWKLEDAGTVFNEPVMPPFSMEFAFKATLKNCSNAILSQSVGEQDTRISTYTVRTTETFQLTTTSEESSSETSTYSANLDIQGIDVGGASYEESINLSYGTAVGETRTVTEEKTSQKQVQVSTIRNIEVPTFTAVEVFDAVYTSYDIKVPFVQKIRIEGSYENKKLSGEEIISQLVAKPFDGVITETGKDYIVVTIKGETQIDKLMETTTNVNELEGFCN